MEAFLAILAALSILYSPAASACTGTIEQNFAASLAAVPAENLAVSGGVGHYAFISQRRPIKIAKN
ncbi:hypothetical protein V1279_005047 [Bradyrhizobium sp. AZCC 1610]|uniref:hypothetical protein n=1 Tax=Bradyrhizobium sp. AZCC 1610 TaxID=3117020 RepID=UPI002FF16921